MEIRIYYEDTDCGGGVYFRDLRRCLFDAGARPVLRILRCPHTPCSSWQSQILALRQSRMEPPPHARVAHW